MSILATILMLTTPISILLTFKYAAEAIAACREAKLTRAKMERNRVRFETRRKRMILASELRYARARAERKAKADADLREFDARMARIDQMLSERGEGAA